MGTIGQAPVRITPAKLVVRREYELDHQVNDVSAFLESTPTPDGWAVCLILKCGENQIRAEFHPHLPPTSVIPTNLIVVISHDPKGIAANLKGPGDPRATMTFEAIKSLLPKFQSRD